jgi:hypothetical protein
MFVVGGKEWVIRVNKVKVTTHRVRPCHREIRRGDQCMVVMDRVDKAGDNSRN